MEVMALLLLLVAVLGVVLASSLLLRWNELRYSRRRGLPPGTMGWPHFGETTEFLKQGPSFMKQRRLRYQPRPHSARRPVPCSASSFTLVCLPKSRGVRASVPCSPAFALTTAVSVTGSIIR